MYKRMLRSVLAATFVAALAYGALGGDDISWNTEASAPGDISWGTEAASAPGDISWGVAPAHADA
ncbi:hypothetical protein AR457_16800 [Streptomyces agglomeratus]|uniref:5'-nucleotidase n=1 Tax=Streptomyces agglomeratus TaxID=285458 RepID=A0A1E5P8K6_9ACTN|nr:hypothetical protein AS594_16565 [Streptomyces agglomeratus]OEJ42494.1 hypothetical protein BGK70_19850 [Streptomyces agglomeratus]OEJ48995.1 hypothetical protein AR457_16800 [Streptomyces agglomeratus]OEJ55814.1 hypothetical protein BGK72_19550 [Streptomyces agglomeratus]OEJ63198.1 hypothetical protein BGM19_20370 [Streptomyces agglomeratus]